ncbi:MAG: efflux RND transporter periplasmic adaptor subunit [Chthoniobacterales bacterium]
MKKLFSISSISKKTATLLLSAFFTLQANASERSQNTVILNDEALKNLNIKLAIAEESDFEETIFSIGRIEIDPKNQAVLSSRIPGRISIINAQVGDMVTKGQELVRIESRQPGNPAPSIPLSAPIDGLVVESHVSLGQPVEPSNELLDIVNIKEMYAIARVPEHYAARLKIGETIARIRVSALGDTSLTGTLLRIGTSADRASASIDAVFRVENPNLALRPNMRAEFSIVTERRENILSIPRSAVQGDPSNRIVFVKDFDLKNAFIRTPVELGKRNESSVEIKKGLFPGDEVVTTGSYLLNFVNNDKASLKEALDAAHGHSHAEDGSEPSESGEEKDHAEGDEHDYAEAAEAKGSLAAFFTLPTIIFAALSFILLVALLSTLSRRKN